LKEGKQLITLSDVENVEARMEKPSEFAAEKDETDQSVFTSGANRKLYINVGYRIIAGVCAGISHYFVLRLNGLNLFLLSFLYLMALA
jgi:hypothetical protein